MSVKGGPNTVTSGLVLELDAGNIKSYQSGSTTWFDKSGFANNGTLINGPTFNTGSNGSIVFDGVDDYVTFTRPVQDDFTLSCWFKTIQSFGNSFAWYYGAGLVDGERGGVQNDFGLSIGGGKLAFGVGNPDTTITSSLTYNNNIWHNVAATRVKSTGTLTLYVDGQQVSTGTGGVQSLTTPPNITIGSLSTNLNFFNGNISIAQLYNRALSAQEVLQNYTATKTRFGL